MNKAIFACIIIFVFSMFVSEVGAQVKTLKGYVTTFDSIPLINTEVTALKSKTKVLTDSLGNFEIKCLWEDKIKVRAKGFVTQRVKIDEAIKYALVNLKLKPSPKSQENTVGYGHVKDADKLNALSSLRNEGNNFSNFLSRYDLIRAQIPGVNIVNNEIIIPGKNSINGSGTALIVIDGAVVNSAALEMLRPVNVKSVNVLKDVQLQFMVRAVQMAW